MDPSTTVFYTLSLHDALPISDDYGDGHPMFPSLGDDGRLSRSVRCLHETTIDASVDEDVERRQLSILHPAYVDAFGDSGSAGRSVLPRNAPNTEVLLNRRGDLKHGARKLVL